MLKAIWFVRLIVSWIITIFLVGVSCVVLTVCGFDDEAKTLWNCAWNL